MVMSILFSCYGFDLIKCGARFTFGNVEQNDRTVRTKMCNSNKQNYQFTIYTNTDILPRYTLLQFI